MGRRGQEQGDEATGPGMLKAPGNPRREERQEDISACELPHTGCKHHLFP
jgi:hypothetical protein